MTDRARMERLIIQTARHRLAAQGEAFI